MTNNLLSLLKTDFLNRFRLGTIRNERNKKVKYRYIAMGVLYISSQLFWQVTALEFHMATAILGCPMWFLAMRL